MINQKKNIRTLVVFLVIFSIGWIFSMKQNHQDKIRTDREPIEKRFPKFPEEEKLFWVGEVTGENTIGPTSLKISIWIVMKKNDFNDFVRLENFRVVNHFNPSFIPHELENKIDRWEKVENPYEFSKKKLGESQFTSNIYIDRDHHTIYIDAVGPR